MPTWDEREMVRDAAGNLIGAVRRNHMIDQTTGRPAVFVVGEPAWHRLGRALPAGIKGAEAIVESGQNWTIGQYPLRAVLSDGRQVDVPGRVANVREDTGAVLGDVGAGYRVFQNQELYDLVDSVVAESGGATYDSAGSLRGGKLVWIMAKMPRRMEAVPGDEVESYVVAANGHDGTRACHLFATTARVVCWNTLNLALNQAGANKMTFWHTGNLTNKVTGARKFLGLAEKRLDVFQEQLARLAAVSMPETAVKDYFEELFPTRRTGQSEVVNVDGAALLGQLLDGAEAQAEVVSDLVAAHREAEDRLHERNKRILAQLLDNFGNERQTLPGIEGTAWAAYNAVSEFADHQGRSASAENRMFSSFWGKADEVKQEAFSAALRLAN